jgi:hypothetical protein
VVLPRGDLTAQGFDVRDSAAQALAVEGAEFDFCDVEPAAVFGRVVDFETIGQAARFDGREGFVERGDGMGVEVVHDQSHLDGFGVALFEHSLDEVSPTLRVRRSVTSTWRRPASGSTSTKSMATPWRTYS